MAYFYTHFSSNLGSKVGSQGAQRNNWLLTIPSLQRFLTCAAKSFTVIWGHKDLISETSEIKNTIFGGGGTPAVCNGGTWHGHCLSYRKETCGYELHTGRGHSEWWKSAEVGCSISMEGRCRCACMPRNAYLSASMHTWEHAGTGGRAWGAHG